MTVIYSMMWIQILCARFSMKKGVMKGKKKEQNGQAYIKFNRLHPVPERGQSSNRQQSQCQRTNAPKYQ